MSESQHHTTQPNDVGQPYGGSGGPVADGTGDAPPETGDIIIDTAVRDLAGTPKDDLDTLITRAEALHETLRARLSDISE